jgi:P4 family phage/plasmid primase-like protien
MLEIKLKTATEIFNYGFVSVEKFLSHIQDINTDISNALSQEYVLGSQKAHDLFSNYLFFDVKDSELFREYSHFSCDNVLILPVLFKMDSAQISQEIDILIQSMGIVKVEQIALTFTAEKLSLSMVHITDKVYELKSTNEFNADLKRAYSYFGGHIMRTKNHFYLYNPHSGVWEQETKDSIKATLFNDFFKQNIDLKEFNKFFKIFEISLHVDEFPVTPNHLLILENGAFDPVKRTLVEHNPFFYARHKIGFSYNPDATAPRWLQFLAEIFSHQNENGEIVRDVDSEDKIAMLKEFLGLSLTADTSYCKALVLQGDGSNGKSVILSVLKSLVGIDNYTTVSLKELKDKFKAVRLKDKLVNIDSDGDTNFLKYSEAKIKMLIGGESTIVEEKYRAAELLKPRAKFWVGMNHLPRVNACSFSNGIERRFEFLHFGRKFDDGEADLHILVKLTAELAGIFNFALDGLADLNRQGKFTIPSSSIEIKRELSRLNDPVKDFYMERLERLPENALRKTGLTATQLLSELEIFAADNGSDISNLKTNQLSTSLKRFNLKSHRYQGKTLFPVKIKEIKTESDE